MAHIWKDKRTAYKRQKLESREGASIIAVGEFCIDPVARCAIVRGHRIQLTAAEFDVLVYVTSHRKQVVTSRTTLALKSADQGVRQTDFLRNLLSLRKKLQEELPDSHYVQTAAWILYVFDPGTSANSEKGI